MALIAQEVFQYTFVPDDHKDSGMQLSADKRGG